MRNRSKTLLDDAYSSFECTHENSTIDRLSEASRQYPRRKFQNGFIERKRKEENQHERLFGANCWVDTVREGISGIEDHKSRSNTADELFDTTPLGRWIHVVTVDNLAVDTVERTGNGSTVLTCCPSMNEGLDHVARFLEDRWACSYLKLLLRCLSSSSSNFVQIDSENEN